MAQAYPSTETLQELAGLYVGFFGRAADAEGYQFWANSMTTHISVLTAFGYTAEQAQAIAQQDVANKFANSDEFKSQYGALDPTQQVTKVYNNVLNREPDPDGLAYWVNLLNTGSTLPSVVTGIINSCLQQGESTADGRLVLNKIEVSRYFAEYLSSNNIEVAETAFNTITEDNATVVPAERSLLIETANQIELTVRPDTFRGISGNNTFDGLGAVNASGQLVQTLQNGDSLIGSANGTNTLKANLFESNVTPTLLQNINWLELTNQGTAGSTLNIVNSDAVDIVNFNNLEGNFTLAGVRDAETNFRINNTSGLAVNITASASAVVGDSDIAIVDITNSSIELSLDSRYEAADIESIAGIGTLNSIDTDFAGDLIIEGAGNLALTGSSGTVKSTDIDATGLTGTLNIAGLTDADITFVGGNGDTTINADAVVSATSNLNFTFGNGTDLLQISTLVAVSNATSVVGGDGVDTLELTALVNGGVDGSFAKISGFETFEFGANTANSMTIGAEFVEAGFVTITGSASADTVTASQVALTNLTFNGGVGNDVFTFNNTASGTITISAVETVASGGAAGNVNQTVNIADVSGVTASVSLAGGTADTVNLLDGVNNVKVTTSGVENITTGASVTGNTVVLGDNSTVVTITGGSGQLTVDATAVSTANNTYSFGGAADTLLVASLAAVSNATSVVGGDGVDTLELTALVNGGVDGSFAKISGFETFEFGANTANSMTIGAEFVEAGFVTITGSASADTVTASQVALTNLTFNGGVGNDVFTFNNTASGTITISAVETVASGGAAGNVNQTVNIADVSGVTASVSLAGGTADTVNLLDGVNNVKVTTSGVENITTGASVTGNTVVLGDNSTVVTITGGSGQLTVDATAVSTANNTYSFGGAADTLLVASLAAVSNATSVVGGDGVDTLELTALVNGGVDGSFAKISGFETFEFGANTANSMTIGAEFVEAGFVTITGSASADTVTASQVALTNLTFNGGVGNDVFTFNNTASGTITISAVETVASGGAAGNVNQTVNIAAGASAPTITINLAGGNGDTVNNLNTAGAQVTLSGVEFYNGSIGDDAITLSTAGAISIIGGGGTDTVTLSTNTANATISASDAAMGVIGTLELADAVTINGNGVYSLTSVETVTVDSSADDVALFSTLISTAGDVVLATYNLEDSTTATFALASEGGGTGAVFLTVNSGENSEIVFLDSNFAYSEDTAGVIISTQDLGFTSITLGTASSSIDAIATNLGELSDGYLITDSFVIEAGFDTASDSIDLTGTTLVSGNGSAKVLQASVLESDGFNFVDSFTSSQFVTGNSTTLANISTGANQLGLIFQFEMEGSVTASFNSQAGINAAVDYITATMSSSSRANQQAVFVVQSNASGDDTNALFLFSSNGVAGAISSAELKLIGVVSGDLNVNSFT